MARRWQSTFASAISAITTRGATNLVRLITMQPLRIDAMEQEITTVADVPDDYTLCESHDSVMHVLGHIDVDAEDYRHGHLFVRTQDGEYTDVLWFSGVVPYLHKFVTRLL